MSPNFIFSEKTQNQCIHFYSDSSLKYQLYPAEIETKVKEDVAEFQKTWLFDRFGTLTLKEIS
jgi:hypothetical protein